MGKKKNYSKSQIPSRRRSRRMAQLRRRKQGEVQSQESQYETLDITCNNEDSGTVPHITPAFVATPVIETFVSTSANNNTEDISEDDSDMLLHQEKEVHPEGRRVVALDDLFKQIFEMNDHGPTGCNITNMFILKEKILGLCSIITLKCKMCGILKDIATDNDENSDDSDVKVNQAATIGIISSGIGYTTANEFMSCLNIPFMSHKTFAHYQENLADTFHTILWSQIEENGKKEAELARINGDLDDDGIPVITVITDGAWSKRSYNVNYNALSGVACIIGERTRKVLFCAVKNKYCCICARAENKGTTASIHTCYKNFDGPSTAMETEIIVDGFKKSIDMHGIKYKRLVGDGDSSVYKKLMQSRPYGTTIIEKVECSNHLLRNFSKHIRELTLRRKSNSKNVVVTPQLRKIVGNRLLRLVSSIKKAATYRRNQNISIQEKISLLIADMKNIPSHVFGEHSSCHERNYFQCEPADDEINYIPSMTECGLYEDLLACFKRLIEKAYSLILNMTTNAAEQYNSIVCKFVGGKRINYSLRRSYTTRCEAAAIAYNSGSDFHRIVHKKLTHTSPRGPKSRFIKKIKNQRETYLQYKSCKKQLFKKRIVATPDEYYGTELTEFRPDLSPEEYEKQASEFLCKLKKTPEEIRTIERATMEQAGSPLWFQERAHRITASNFKDICSMRNGTSCKNKVMKLLYNTFTGNESTRYGRHNEIRAIKDFEQQFGITVEKCGFFIDANHCMLGASPDGLIGTDGLIEVKCPANAAGLPPLEAVKQNKIKYVTLDKESQTVSLKKNHQYYFQIQGQLHVTQRTYCYFIIWTPHGILVEKIHRDDAFWKEKMEKQLLDFYYKCLLPEIVDPRHSRGLEIRNP